MAEKLNRLQSYNLTKRAVGINVISLKKSKSRSVTDKADRISRDFSGAFVGRDYEMSELKSIFFRQKKKLLSNQKITGKEKISSNGTRPEKQTVIGIKGNAGIGKTRLIREFLKSHSKHFLTAQSDSFVQSPYFLFLNLLKNFCRISRLDSHEQIKDKLRFAHKDLANYIKSRILKREFPNGFNIICHMLGINSKDSRIKLPASELKLHIQISLSNFILGIGAKANFHNEPLVFVLDNVHWIDDASMNSFVFFLMTMNILKNDRADNHIQILPILLYRPEFRKPKEFESNFDFTEIEIQPLDTESAKKLIKNNRIKTSSKSIKYAENSGAVNEIIGRSEGNPLYIQEWNKFINERITGDGKEKNAKTLKENLKNTEVPDSINLLIEMRLQNLNNDEKEVLQCASVLGREFTIELLEVMLKTLGKNFDFKNILLKLIDNRFIEKSKDVNNRFSFHHDVLRDVIYDSISKENRKTIHYAAGNSMEKLFKENLGQYYYKLAEHYIKSDSVEKAIEYLLKSGDKAKDSFENEKAIEYYDKIISSGWMTDEKQFEIYFKKLELLKHIGKWDEAVAICDELKKNKPLSSDDDLHSKLSLVKAELLHNKCEYSKSNTLIKKAESALKNKFSSSFTILMCQNFILLGKLTKAKENGELLLSESEKKNDQIDIARAFDLLGHINRLQGNFNESLSCYNKSIKIFEKEGDFINVSFLTYKIGTVYFYLSDYKKSIYYLEKAIENNIRTGSLLGYSNALGNLGNVFYMTGDIKTAKTHLTKKLEICNKLNYKDGTAAAYSALGNIYLKEGFYDKALDSYNRCLSIFESIGRLSGIANAKFNIGLIHYNKGNYGEALSYYNEQMSIYLSLSNKQGILDGYLNLGNLYRRLNKFENAEECYLKSISLAKEIGSKNLIAISNFNYSELLFDTNNIEKAEIYNNQAMQLATNSGFTQITFLCSILKEKIEFAKEHEKMSLDLDRNFLSLTRNKLNQIIGRMEDFFTDAKSELEIATLHFEIWKLKKSINAKGIAANRSQALKLFEKLYQTAPDIEYQSNILELKI